jgi:serine/threonine-protein kinase
MPIVGDVLADRYRIESILGVGGMASVYLATDIRLDRQVAVKVLVANLAADAQFAERFNREAGAMAGFSHPNVVAVYDVEPGDPATGREPFYVMEYCRDGSLADRLKVAGRMQPDELVPIVSAVSEGLAELHTRGLIHRDVKPANILFANERPKLADFGVAWSQGPSDGNPLTLPGSTPGTEPYLSPELVAGQPPSAASDVYALGVTIFQALTGQYPQPSRAAEGDADSQPATLLPVSAAAPDLGLRFDTALAAALDADPSARPSPTDLAAQLATTLRNWGVARPNPGVVTPPDPRPVALSAEDMEAPTRVASVRLAESPVASPARPAPAEPAPTAQDHQPPATEHSAPQPTRQRLGASPPGRLRNRWQAVTVAVLALVAVLVLPRLLGGSDGFEVASPEASAEATAEATAAEATAAPSASAISGDVETVLTALSRVDAAIEEARGGKDGLKGRAGTELEQLAGSVRTSVVGGDLDAAATAARALSDQAPDLTKGIDGPRRDAILAAIDDVLAALSTP